MFNIFSYQGNINQNHLQFSFYLNPNGQDNKQMTAHAGEDVGKGGQLFITEGTENF